MTLLAPLWLLLIPAGALAIFLLHRRREKQTYVGSLYVWKRIQRPDERMSPTKSFRLSRAMLLQLLALVLVTGALAEPRLGDDGGVVHNVVVLDSSYRMYSGGRPIEEVYERLVARELASWDGTAPLSIVLAEVEPKILLARSRSQRSLRQALNSLAPSDAGPDWYAAALTVRSLLVPDEAARVYVVSPLAAAPAAETFRRVLDQAEVSAVPVPIEGSNTGFVSADVRPLEAGQTYTWAIEGQVRTQEATSVTMRIEYRRLGTVSWLPWQEQLLDLPADVVKGFTAQVTVPGPGMLRLLLPSDAIETDDVVQFVLSDEARRARILIVGTVDGALVRALAAVPDVLIQRADELPDTSSDFDLVVVDRVAVERHPGTNTLWIGSSLDGGLGDRTAIQGRAVDWGEHVLNAGVDWRGLELDEARDVPLLAGANVLLQAGEIPLVQFQRHEAGIDVTWAFAISDGNASRLAAPVIFLDNLLRLLVPNIGEFVGLRCNVGVDCYLPPSIAGLAAPRPIDVAARSEGGLGGSEQQRSPANDARVHEVPTLPRFIPRLGGLYWVGEGANESLLAVNAIPPMFVDVPVADTTGAKLDLDFPVSLRRTLLLIAILIVIGEIAISARADLATDLSRSVPRRRLLRHAIPATIAVGAMSVLIGAYISRSDGVGARAILLLDAFAFSSSPWPPDGAMSTQLAEYASSIAEGDLGGGVVAIAAESGVVAAPWPVTTDGKASPSPDGADLLSGLRIAEAMGERDTRVLLATPGASTRGDLTQIFQQLQGSDLVVDTYGLEGVPPGETLVESVKAPQTVRVGQEVEAMFVLFSDVDQEVRLRVSLNDETLEDRIVELRSGRTELSSTFDAPDSSAQLTVSIDPPIDVFHTNNASGVYLNVRPRRPVIVVTSDQESPPAIVEALRGQGYAVDVQTPELAPWTMERWLTYEAVVVVDVKADRLGVPRQEQLVRYVRDHGGGLAITGGMSSYGAGGYLGTPLEEVAPVSSVFPRDAPEAAMIFIMDRSGSMQQPVGTSNRLELAKQAVIQAIGLLPDSNLVSVIAFDSEPSTLVPFQEAGDIEGVISALARLFPSGGTAAYPALATALEAASGLDLETIHVVLLSDGLSQPADFAGLLAKYSEAGITVSTVGIGQSANSEQLRDIASWGGGVFHQSVDLATLPSILSQEALLMSGSPIDETAFRPRVVDAETGILDGFGGAFELGGMVLTTAKPSATVVMERDHESPLLVGWQYGLGRALAFTSDVQPLWSTEFAASEDFPRLWGQALDWLAPVVPPPGVSAAVARYGDDLKLLAEVTSPSGEPVPGLVLRARLASPSGSDDRLVDMREVRSGLYEATVTVQESGRYGFEISAEPIGDLRFEPHSFEYDVSYPQRYNFGALSTSLSSSIARATGGMALDESSLETYLRQRPVVALRAEEWRLLGLAALALWFVCLTWRYTRGSWTA